jgi:hypothetical protein
MRTLDRLSAELPARATRHRVSAAILAMLLVLVLVPVPVVGQNEGLVEVTYLPTDDIFPNPERGFYRWTEGVPGGATLNPVTLAGYRAENQSLIIRLYYIADFRESDFTHSFLNQIETDFGAMREAGIKSILRFRYTKNENDPDAPLERVLGHLEQLRPVFERNYDVIAAVQAGFIGAWGEWHASSNNLTTPDNMRAVLFKILDVLPGRHVQVRYPEAKMQIFATHTALTPEQAFDGSNIARTGHHNDCFLASRNDVGTYRISPTWEKNYLSADNRYLPMGGETCRVREGEYFHCENALHEMEWLRWSYLNSSYYRGILDHWVDEGCMPDVMRRLGYRFVMQQGRFSEQVRPGGALRFELDITNEGFASPFNPRGLQVILKSLLDPEVVYEVNLPSDPRLWLGGQSQSLAFDLGIPEDLEEGFFETYLFLHDPVSGLRARPEYAVRMANENVWVESSGYNDLGHLLVVDAEAPGGDYDGPLWFVPEGTSTSAEAETPGTSPSITLGVNYPNPFNSSTTITFELPDARHVTMDIYNLLGQKIGRILDGHRREGMHEVAFEAVDLPGGIYYYVLTAGGVSTVRSMILVK